VAGATSDTFRATPTVVIFLNFELLTASRKGIGCDGTSATPSYQITPPTFARSYPSAVIALPNAVAFNGSASCVAHQLSNAVRASFAATNEPRRFTSASLAQRAARSLSVAGSAGLSP